MKITEGKGLRSAFQIGNNFANRYCDLTKEIHALNIDTHKRIVPSTQVIDH